MGSCIYVCSGLISSRTMLAIYNTALQYILEVLAQISCTSNVPFGNLPYHLLPSPRMCTFLVMKEPTSQRYGRIGAF